MKIFLLIFLFSALIGRLSAQKEDKPSVVDYVDLKKYIGLWYEIAKIPNRFQEDCLKNTTAEYKLIDDGKIEVVNSCIEHDGERNVAEGVARVADKKTNAKLEVSFVNIFGINLFWGDYWIIGLDENYDYAVIGSPEREYGWILSRSKEMSQEHLAKAFDLLKRKGYNTDRFKMSVQE